MEMDSPDVLVLLTLNNRSDVNVIRSFYPSAVMIELKRVQQLTVHNHLMYWKQVSFLCNQNWVREGEENLIAKKIIIFRIQLRLIRHTEIVDK